MGGLLDMILGASNPVSQFVDSHSNTIANIGPAISSGNWANVAAGKQQDYQNTLQQNALQLAVQQRNATAQWLTQIGHPELAGPVAAGAISGSDAFNQIYKQTPVAPGDSVINGFGQVTSGGSGTQPPADPANPPRGANLGDPYQGVVNGQPVMLQGSQFGGPSVLGPVSGNGNTPAAPSGLSIQSPADAAAQKAGATTLAQGQSKLLAAQPGAASLLRQQTDVVNNLMGDPSANSGWAQYTPGGQGLINQAITQAQVPGATGWFGQLTAGRSGSPAANLNATLDAIKASRAIDNLEQFRQIAADSGGGSSMRFTNTDVNLLKNMGSSFSPSQDQANLVQSLQSFKKQLGQTTANMHQSYQDIFGKFNTPQAATVPLSPQQPLPAQSQPIPVSTPAAYAALPQGAKYVDPQGNIRVKQ